jgi:hypothetical protein
LTNWQADKNRRVGLLYGDGSDGSATISGATPLSKNMYYSDLTLNAGAAITSNGYVIHVQNTLTISSAPAASITYNGNAGGNAAANAGGAAGAAQAATYLPGPQRGVAGPNGTGSSSGSATTPAAVAYTHGGMGGRSMAGGNGSSGNGGAETVANTPKQQIFLPNMNHEVNWAFNTAGFAGGAGVGGSSGGAGSFNPGGGGGASGNSGGMIMIFARIIARGANATAGIIQAIGGAGGNGGNATGGNGGGGAGGGGGGGGSILIVCDQRTGASIADAVDASGGNGGNGGDLTGTGTDGAGSKGGCAGQACVIEHLTKTATVAGPGQTEGDNAGKTGGTGVAAKVAL